MSGTFRPRRVAQSAVNAPTAVHVRSSKSIKKSEAEVILSEFIATSESIAASLPDSFTDNVSFATTGLSNSSESNAVLSQLKRVQRDLRGLPPLSADFGSSTTESQSKKIKFDDSGIESESQPANKKIKFDEESSDDIEPTQEQADTKDELIEEENDSEPEKDEHKEKKEKKDKKEKKEKKEKKDKKEKKEKKHKKHDTA